jgi:hypothetical protein
MKTSETIEKIASDIETVLNEHSFSVPNDFVPMRIRFLAAQLNGLDRDAARYAYKIAAHADIFYSTRKHAKYPGGAEALWAEMVFGFLNVIKSRAQLRKESGD